MILGIGIDTVDVHRFAAYASQSDDMLQKIFSPSEIAYCLSKKDPAPHFASRFAAREAFLKAYQAMMVHHYNQEPMANLFTINKNVKVTHTNHGIPLLQVTWEHIIPEYIIPPNVHISISHTQTVATVSIIISRDQSGAR